MVASFCNDSSPKKRWDEEMDGTIEASEATSLPYIVKVNKRTCLKQGRRQGRRPNVVNLSQYICYTIFKFMCASTLTCTHTGLYLHENAQVNIDRHGKVKRDARVVGDEHHSRHSIMSQIR